MARKSTIGFSPLDLIVPQKPSSQPKKTIKKQAKPEPKKPSIERERVTIQIPVETVERARNASYWDRIPFAQIVDDALNAAVDKMERARGDTYPERETGLRAGRPFKRK